MNLSKTISPIAEGVQAQAAALFRSLAGALAFSFALAAPLAVAHPTIWIEGENARSTDFIPGPSVNAAPDGSGASAGLVLALNVAAREGDAYHAEYAFQAPEAGRYAMWIATTPHPAGWVSPLRFSLDGRESATVAGPVSGQAYGNATNRFYGWINCGTFELAKGEHTLRFEVSEPHRTDGRMVAFLDAILFTAEPGFVPAGNRPGPSPEPPFAERLRGRSFEDYVRELERPLYLRGMARTRERLGPESAAEVLEKLARRPLPSPGFRDPGPQEFGVHGMERPFVQVGVEREKVARAYGLLARAGVQSFRTAESCWHRLGENHDRFTELDYQVESASRYGMTHLFTVGYAPARFNVGGHHLSAVAPGHRERYRDYLAAVIGRYRDRGLRHVELGNEVDAPDTWWRGATPAQYVEEMRLLREVVDELAPDLTVVAFGATYARDEATGGPDGGRRFISRCFDLGIDRYVDAYALHYTWPISAKGFPEFFRAQSARLGVPAKPLFNTEEAGYGKPSDVIKVFARNFFLHGMPRVDYYLAQDWFEEGNLIPSGLFDRDWNPKLRLLAYALSVDAMRDRSLVGLAEPVAGVEAYVLESVAGEGSAPRYSVVFWKNDPAVPELISSAGLALNPVGDAAPVAVTGLTGVTAAWRWNLDPLAPDTDGAYLVADEPVVAFADRLPDWPLMPAAEWLARQERAADSVPMLPAAP